MNRKLNIRIPDFTEPAWCEPTVSLNQILAAIIHVEDRGRSEILKLLKQAEKTPSMHEGVRETYTITQKLFDLLRAHIYVEAAEVVEAQVKKGPIK